MPLKNTYKKIRLPKTGLRFDLLLFVFFFTISGCSLAIISYEITTGAIKTCIWAVKGAYELTAGATKLVYKIGEYTYEVVRAPVEATLTRVEIDSIDGLPVKEAIRSIGSLTSVWGKPNNSAFMRRGRPWSGSKPYN
jgi:hypothetical protein